MELASLEDKVYKGLYLPVSGTPSIITDTLSKAVQYVFPDQNVLISTFDGINNYYHVTHSIYSSVNFIATHLKRVYTSNYNINNVIRGDIIIYSSSKYLPDEIDSSVNYYFIQEILTYASQVSYVY